MIIIKQEDLKMTKSKVPQRLLTPFNCQGTGWEKPRGYDGPYSRFGDGSRKPPTRELCPSEQGSNYGAMQRGNSGYRPTS